MSRTQVFAVLTVCGLLTVGQGMAYTLTVNSGSGDGSYSESQVVDITADAAASGKFFDAWTGDTSNIADINDPSTTITMPASDAEITATYTWVASGLVTRFTFDIDARDTYGNNDGTLNGATVTNDATRGKVVSFDGTNDTVSLPTSGLTAGRGELTLSMWIKPDELVGTDTIYDAHYNWYWQFAIRQDKWYTRDSSTGTTGSRNNDLPLPGLTASTWQHLAFVYSASGDTKAIYLDGEESTSTSTSVDTLTSDRDDELLGAISDGTHYDGMMDDVRLYSRALSSNEIELLAEVEYTLTVNSGTGDGDYMPETVVDITADTAPSGKQFDQWVGDTEGIASLTSASTTLTMPYDDAEVAATYTDKTWTLTVNSGTGDGSYVVGTIVDIDADTAPSGKQFDEWVGDTEGIASLTSASTTLTMPYADAEVTATYEDIPTTYTLTVNSGTGDGDYSPSTVVDIDADTAPSGMLFDKWSGDTTGIADINDPSTTLTMPSSNAEITAQYTWVASGLVSRYTFDVDASDSYGNNDGTLTDGASVTTDGTRGKVLSLDGDNDYVSLPSSAMAAGRSELTLSMWVNPDTWASGDTIYDEYASGNYWQFTVIYGAFYTRDSSTGTTGSRDNDITMPSISTGSWHHLALVYSTSGDKKAVYYDGSLHSSTSTSIDTLTSSRDGVGIGYACDGNHFDGKVDDVRLYNRALNTTEIARLAEQPIYDLTVNSGSGDGEYPENEVVDIDADTAPSGKEFDEWIGDTSGIASVTSASTTITIGTSDAEITATYADITYMLTVNSGTGDGSYVEGATPTITADTAPSGQEFDEWIGDTSGIANVNASSTTLTMPAADQEVTATYTDKTWTLTVNSGSGDGDYVVATVVDIDADTAPSGQEFDEWVGDTEGIASLTSASTTLTMPYADAEVTATYTDKKWTLTVNSGTGDGSYVVATVVDIDADSPASGKQFDEWIGDTEGIASLTSASTTLTMPYANAEITATYEDTAAGTTQLIVDWGDSEANNVYDFSDWDNVYLGPYQSYTSAGPDGIYGSTTAKYTTCGVNGSSETFSEGDQIVVTFYNNTGSSKTFTPKVSFDDPDYPDGGSSGTWYSMNEIQLDDAETGTSGYTFTSGTAGSYSRVHVCRNISNSSQLVTDKIQLVTEGGGASTYILTVNSGTGDGSYTESTVVDIDADTAPSGKTFDEWVGDTSGIANVSASSTTLTMPAANQTITATYESAATYTLTVNSGSGDGNYTASTIVDITADTAPSGKVFDDWVGDTSGIADVEDPTTTLTMPAANQEVTATYEDAPSGPSVSGVSGTIDQWETITVSGSGFGSGPNVVLFDDFELGTDGEDIMTGSGSARYGQWNATTGITYYDNTTSVSGSLAFQADHSEGWVNYAECLLPSGTMDVFGCWWLYIPSGDKIPGEGGTPPNTTNWKTVWLQGEGTTDDDQTLPTFLETSKVIGGNDSPYNKYLTIGFQKGEWKRVWVWIEGGYSSDGACHYWELDDPNGVIQRVNDNNVSTMYSGGERERIRMNGYGRQTSNCHPGFDDFYVATGSNARARVEIGNDSTYSNCTALAICVPTSWSSSSITAKVNIGGLDSGDSWYLFVFDAGNDGSSGYKVKD